MRTTRSVMSTQGMSDIIMFLHQLFFITCGECVLRDLRCALVEIQSKNGPVTVKVSHSSNVVVVSGGNVSPLLDIILKQTNSIKYRRNE
ncbi:hypothetical protein V1477_013630 [Vespula maculifrons]|uniref:Uncharacterized protein n=2 Tax=Vespula maculifrons TaxID=7453 RepID=A0ABD2BQ58_VESMC